MRYDEAIVAMIQDLSVKTVLKRGALVTAANWQVTVIQFVADATFKMLLSVPVVGGVLLVALVLGRELPELVAGDLRVNMAYVASALLAEPYALAAFLVALGIVAATGAIFMVLVKGGTVTVLAQAESQAEAVEMPPLVLRLFWTAAAFSTAKYQAGCEKMFRRYLRLSLLLGVVYVVSGAAYVAVLFGGVGFGHSLESGWNWTLAAVIVSVLMVVWITVVNFFYLLVQMVVVVEDCSVRNGAGRVLRFLSAEPRLAFGALGVVLALVVGATFVSLIATTSLGVIAFVPLAGLVVIPLQLLAWMFRGIVFQFLGLGALGAYLTLYRRHKAAVAAPAVDLAADWAPPES